jgi:hypothetical protein
MKISKVLRVKTEADSHIVVRNRTGKKLFELDLPGVSVTLAVPQDAEIQVDSRPPKPALLDRNSGDQQ